MKKSLQRIKVHPVERILDANLNRAKEGLRVCEEVCRFVLNDRCLTRRLKDARHRLTGLMQAVSPQSGLLKERASISDVGRTVYGKELSRFSVQDIFFANIQRVKESVRVLEEFSKLKKVKAAVGFKDLRYIIYDIEKNVGRMITDKG